jgi:hypothetical protein
MRGPWSIKNNGVLDISRCIHRRPPAFSTLRENRRPCPNRPDCIPKPARRSAGNPPEKSGVRGDAQPGYTAKNLLHSIFSHSLSRYASRKGL